MNIQNHHHTQVTCPYRQAAQYYLIVQQNFLLVPLFMVIVMAVGFAIQNYFPERYQKIVTLHEKMQPGNSLSERILGTHPTLLSIRTENLIEPGGNVRTTKAALFSAPQSIENVQKQAQKESRKVHLNLLKQTASSEEFRMAALAEYQSIEGQPRSKLGTCPDLRECASRFKISSQRQQPDVLTINYIGNSIEEANASIAALISRLQNKSRLVELTKLKMELETQRKLVELELRNYTRLTSAQYADISYQSSIPNSDTSTGASFMIEALRSELKHLAEIDLSDWVGETLVVTEIETAKEDHFIHKWYFLLIAAVVGIVSGIAACYIFHSFRLIKQELQLVANDRVHQAV